MAICIDRDGHELIAFGKGIGFHKIPYELTNLSLIWRTYYGINPSYLHLLDEIPEEIFTISVQIVDMAKRYIVHAINGNIVFTLADHINFAIERQKQNISIKMPFCYDIQHLYENEMKVGEQAVAMIQKNLKVYLPKEEAISIALHFINAENMQQNVEDETNEKQMIAEFTRIIEDDFSLTLNVDSFNYSRFVTHMQYLLKRSERNISITSENEKMFEMIKTTYSKTYECARHINIYLQEKLNWNLNEEELLYLMLHINRLCAREDCNQ